jgi:hypothetical protein
LVGRAERKRLILSSPIVVAGPGLLRRVELGDDHVTGVDALNAKPSSARDRMVMRDKEVVAA